jgi:hypothetical protein
MVVMLDLISVRFAGSEPSSIFGEQVSRALMQLTCLKMLDLASMFFTVLLGRGRGLYFGGG